MILTKAQHKCADCPREADEVRARIRAVPNAGVGGQLDPPLDVAFEVAWLCDNCAPLRDDVL